MTAARHSLLVVIAALAALAALGGASAAPAAAARACEDVIYRTPQGDVYGRTYYLTAYRTGCTTARRVALAWLRGAEGNAGPPPRPLGFTCRRTSTRNGDGMACRKGRRSVRWLWQRP